MCQECTFCVVVDPIWKPDSRRVCCSPAHENNHSLSNNQSLGDDVNMHRIDVGLFIHWPVHEYADKPKIRNTKEYIFRSWASRCSRGGRKNIVDICGYLPFHELARQYFKCEKAADRRCTAFEARCMMEFMRGGSQCKQTLDFAHVPIIALSRSLSLFQDGF